MTSPRISLSISSLILSCSTLFAFSGGLSSYLWLLSNTKWDEHLEKASIAGERIIYEIFLEKKIITSHLLKEIKHNSLIEDLSVAVKSKDPDALVRYFDRFDDAEIQALCKTLHLPVKSSKTQNVSNLVKKLKSKKNNIIFT